MAPPWLPIPPLGYRGIERVVYLLAKAALPGLSESRTR
jgi:hypothetical protein